MIKTIMMLLGVILMVSIVCGKSCDIELKDALY